MNASRGLAAASATARARLPWPAPGKLGGAAWRAAGWAALGLGAVALAALISAHPRAGLALPALIASAVLCARFPAAAVVVAYAVSGAFGSLQAFTGISGAQVVDLVLAGLWISVVVAAVIGRRERKIVLWPSLVALAVYVGLSAFEILTASSLWIGLQAFRLSAWYMAGFLLIAFAGWDRVTYERIARGFLIVAGLVGGYAVFAWLTVPTFAERLLGFETAGAYTFVPGGGLRAFAPTAGGHQLGFWVAMPIPFCLAMAAALRGPWRAVAAAAGALCLVALYGSQVRAGLAGALAGSAAVVILLLLARGFPHVRPLAATAIVTGIVAVGAGVALVAGSGGAGAGGSAGGALDRFAVILDPTGDITYQDRRVRWAAAWEEIEKEPWGHGLGTGGQVHQLEGRFVTIASGSLDSSYLKIAFEQGIAAMVLFIAALLLLFAQLARAALGAARRVDAGLAIGAAGTLAAFIVAMAIRVYVDDVLVLGAWLPIAIGVAPFVSARRSNQRDPQAPS